jgi:DNA-directed RNA polymerase specialized sigma24 family protein
MLGIDEGTSKSQLFKARKTLKAMIESIMASEKQALENQKTKGI